jgi:hypothetical protein
MKAAKITAEFRAKFRAKFHAKLAAELKELRKQYRLERGRGPKKPLPPVSAAAALPIPRRGSGLVWAVSGRKSPPGSQ